ncbi:hypothetical protein FDECE_9282 [Fusarium decemcellulare]|nr:hypothetical protein FDECE_9282 [Fusarium decemcellulare]
MPPFTQPPADPKGSYPPTQSSEELLSQTRTSPKIKSLFKVWGWEGAYLLFSFLSFAVTVIVLAHFNQKNLPDWPLNITLKTFLAFFTALAKAALMLPISTSISQTKWSRFLQNRPLYDFLATSVLVLTVVAQGRSLESDEADPGLLRDLKDSSLATLVALDNDSHMLAGNGLQSVNELKKTAKELRVRMKGNQLVPVDMAQGVSA